MKKENSEKSGIPIVPTGISLNSFESIYDTVRIVSHELTSIPAIQPLFNQDTSMNQIGFQLAYLSLEEINSLLEYFKGLSLLLNQSKTNQILAHRYVEIRYPIITSDNISFIKERLDLLKRELGSIVNYRMNKKTIKYERASLVNPHQDEGRRIDSSYESSLGTFDPEDDDGAD